MLCYVMLCYVLLCYVMFFTEFQNPVAMEEPFRKAGNRSETKTETEVEPETEAEVETANQVDCLNQQWSQSSLDRRKT